MGQKDVTPCCNKPFATVTKPSSNLSVSDEKSTPNPPGSVKENDTLCNASENIYTASTESLLGNWTPTFLEISLQELTGQNILRSPIQPSFHVTTNITGFIVLVHQPSCLVHDIFTGSGRVFFVSQI